MFWQRRLHDNDAKPSIYFLHGALHLVEDFRSGRVRKVTASADSLLDEVIRTWEDSRGTALFVSEGGSNQKRTVIERSAYLRACYQRLRDAPGGFVVLGHGLSPADKHIVDALREGNRPIAIGLHQGETPLDDQIKRLQDEFEGCDVRFFKSEEHPLTIPRIRVKSKNRIWFPPRDL